MFKAFGLVASFWLWVLLGCEMSPNGGSGTVTTNNISGRVVDENNKPIGNTALQLRRSNYLPSIDDLINFQDTSENLNQFNANTDAKGNFSLEEIPPGKYTLEVNQENKLAANVNISIDNWGNQISLPPTTIRPMAMLTGFAPLPQDIKRAWVMVYGLERRIAVDSITGAFSLLVPQGAYTLRTFYLDMQIPRSEIKNVVVSAGEKKSLNPFQEWTTKRLVRINTTASGGDINENLTFFPLLIRLNAANFDFGKAKPNGEDVRFSKENGKQLFYEIERWDFQNKQAEIWVLMDTVYSNNSSQSFYLHSGNLNAQDQSSGADVFGKNKFAGVWHLNENAPETGTQYLYENSVAPFHYGNDFIKNTGKLGSIGLGQSFTREDYISVENVSATIKPDTAFSLSVWIKANTVDSGFLAYPENKLLPPYYEKGSEVLSMGNDFGIRLMGSGKIRFFIFDETQRPPTPDSLLYKIHSTDSSYLDNEWHHIVSTFSNSTMSIYIDGKLDSSKTLEFNKITYDGSPHFFIGRHGNQEPNFDFMGSLDEVRINKNKNSSSWIKLSYKNQHPLSNVVTLDYSEVP
jgi:Concanavalin A-like lectin/glucanases superfamily/Domain of unknown function (DUF2341)/Carboxypeptidase regulatory-like domain